MPNIEDLLRKAMEEGKFDNLRGKGKRLNLGDVNPNADPEWVVAYRMLKDAGYSLPWIETMHEIEQDIETARGDLRLSWEEYQLGYTQSGPASDLSAEWERSQQAFKTKLTAINKRIRDYNLDVPAPRFQRPILNFELELKKITSLSE